MPEPAGLQNEGLKVPILLCPPGMRWGQGRGSSDTACLLITFLWPSKEDLKQGSSARPLAIGTAAY